jgi:HEAT repeat protein
VAFVIARLGDQRGFETIAAVLANRSDRVVAQGIPGWAGKVTPEALSQAQIKSDRYYAVHLLGLLKNPRAVYVLVPLLDDKDVGYHVPWALAQIGDRRAIAPLVQRLETGDATTRVAVISALETLNAREAVPALQKVVDDAGKTRLGDAVTVSQAARHAIAELSRQ